ncbi:MAG: TonB-dependent receptor [Sporocytophaga sp.]|uniref:TonB-dependent receptor n=1 Tax=Sporocytophaga sp. TaxID=2231183 RepID=UPI001B267257|nr:TonB-dependent receptor [Sporocytophaga sp.]MBO9699293.1 TonB-dependent receptor [Sporocytophaga sp.]
MGKQYYLIILFFISAFYSFGQGGFISGTVKDSLNNEVIVGGVVTVVGRSEGTVTDIDGKFVIPIDSGIHALKITFEGYREKVFADVVVKPGETATIDFPISKDKAEGEKQVLKTVSVVGVRTTHTDVAVVNEIRKENNVVSGISSEQMSKSQDRNAAEITRRIPGVTIADDRFIIIRGIGQRYNTVMLNNAIAPSSEAEVRAFSFDILPSGVLDRIMIYKTPAAELPGEFAGGVVKVYTKNAPLTNSISINYSASYRQNTTFQSFYEQKHGKNAWLGYDNTYKFKKGTPEILPKDNDSRNNSQYFNNNWFPEKNIAMPDQRINIMATRRINLSSKVILGSITSINYTNSRNYRKVYREAPTDKITTLPGLVISDKVYDHSVRTGAMQNFSLLIGGNHKLDFKNLFSHIQSSTYYERKSGYFNGYASTFPSDTYQHIFGLGNLDRSLYSGQLNGSHEINTFHVRWTAGYSLNKRDEPDFRRYALIVDKDSDNRIKGDWATLIRSQPGLEEALGRVYNKTDENMKMFSGEIEKLISINEFKPIVKAGFYFENKRRKTQVRSIGIFTKDQYINYYSGLPLEEVFKEKNFQADTALYYGEVTGPNDRYSAGANIRAGYISFTLPITKKLNIVSGVRVESYRQLLETFRDGTNLVKVNLDTSLISYLPSANISYNITSKTLIRLGYGKSLNRPEFRELSLLKFYDFESGTETYGSPDLKTCKIHNFDVRYEIYPNPGETYSLGFFYKRFVNPIEKIVNAGSNGPIYTFDNAISGSSYGAEVEVRKNLGAFFNQKNFLDDFSFNFNVTVVKSEIRLEDARASTEDTKRPMANQSPYIINSGLYYTNDSLKTKISLIYNIIGRRIFAVGNYQFNPVYELPRHSLDLTFSKELIKSFSVVGGIQNILNAPSRFMQDSNNDGKFDRSGKDDLFFISFRTGTYYTLGVTYVF